MSQQIFGAAAAVIALNRAFNDESPANAVFQNQLAAAQADAANGFANFAKAFSASFAGLSNAELAAQVMGNMGLLPNDALQAALVDYLNGPGATNRGLVVLQLATILTGLENAGGNLSVYNAAAAAWNSEITNAYTYSADPANTVPSGDETTAGKTFMLTEGIDAGSAFLGTAGNDTYNAYPVHGDTLNRYDALDGGAGNDVFNIFVDDGVNDVQLGSVKNIETINIEYASGPWFGGEDGIDASKFVGATTINQVGQANDVEKLASTTTAKFTGVELGNAAVGGDDDVVLLVAAATGASSVTINLEDVDGQYDALELQPYPVPPAFIGVDAGPSVRHVVSTENIVISGESLSTVNISGSVNGLAVGHVLTEAEANRLLDDSCATGAEVAQAAQGAVRAEIVAGAAVTELKVNASIATGFVVDGDKVTSIDASGSTADVAYDDQQSHTAGLQSFKSGSGNDVAFVQVFSAKDNPATTTKDETRIATVDLGAGDDTAYLLAKGNGVTNVSLGDGNDSVWVGVDDGDNTNNGSYFSGTVNIDGGAGDDVISLLGEDSAAELFTKLTTVTVGSGSGKVEAASGLKVDGGAGHNTLVVAVGGELTTKVASFIGENVSNVQNLVLVAASKVNAADLSEFSTLTLTNRSEVKNAVATQKLVATTGADLTVTAAGFVAKNDVTPLKLEGSVDIDVLSGDSALTLNAKTVTLAAKTTVVSDESLLGTDGDWATAGNIYLTGTATQVGSGNIETLSVALEGARYDGGSEIVSSFKLGQKDDFTDNDVVIGLKSAVFTGAGTVEFNANKVAGTTLTSIDLSGMTAFLDLDANGEMPLVSSLPVYTNLSTSKVTLNNQVAETLKLGGAHDEVYTQSTVGKMDAIEGFTLVKGSTSSSVDEARSDELHVVPAASEEFVVMGGSYATLNSALAAAATLKVDGTEHDSVVFTVGADTYVFVDAAGGNEIADAGDTLVKLVGVTDATLVAVELNSHLV